MRPNLNGDTGVGADPGLLLKVCMTTPTHTRMSVIYSGLRVVDKATKAAANQLIQAQVCIEAFMNLVLDLFVWKGLAGS